MNKLKLTSVILVLSATSGIFLFRRLPVRISGVFPNSSSPTTTPTMTPTPPPTSHIINNDYQIFQTFNNCGPAALSMALSYFTIHKSQAELGQILRPYQNPYGNNDDKSVSLDELGQQAHEYGLDYYHRPNGNIELLKEFIAAGIPVITRTRLNAGDDIGHFRVIKGYDDNEGVIIQDDSMQGHNLKFTYSEFNDLWQTFNYEYLVLVPPDKIKLADSIIGPDVNRKTAYQRAAEFARGQLANNPDDIYARFNLSVALYHTGDYQGSVAEYEKIQNQLPFRTLWYQLEPVDAYCRLGDYQKIFEISDSIFNRQNRAYSELYILRGKSDMKLGNKRAAKAEFEKAVFYNINLKSAREALKSIQ